MKEHRGDDYVSSFDELFRKDKSVCIHHRNILKVAIEMFKVKHKLCNDAKAKGMGEN